MNKTFIKDVLLLFVVCLLALLSIQARAQDTDLTYSVSFTDRELDDMLAPIALYPDPLLAQMLPASTYPEEIADAQTWLNSGGDVSSIDEQIWAEPVRAIAHYPDILTMMTDNMDWTANLGDAFLNQPEDVSDSIQRLRWRAKAVGNLVSNSEQSVIIDGDYIQIVPAQPQYIYVPQYDTSVVYVQASPTSFSPFITFGFGLMIGDWLSMDFDWGHHYVIYHGWDRPGWVNHARPYVHVRNVYINNSRPVINQRWRHDQSHGDPARYLASRPSGPNADRYERMGEARGSTTTQPRPSGGIYDRGGDTRAYRNRGRESRGVVNQQPAPSIPAVSRRPAIPTPKVNQQPITPPSGFSERRTIPTPKASERPTTPSSGFSEQRTIPIPNVSQRPTRQAPGSGQPPSTPYVSSGSKQPGSVRQQSDRTPSVTFGGYRGTGEAKTQSLRGQSSRQSSERVRPSTPPVSRSVPAGKRASGDRQRR
jgi:hypothetical protein